MEFEFDPSKSETNRRKHGMDFLEARQLWEDHEAMIFPVLHPAERRFILLAKHRGKLWAAVFTLRRGRTCIISVRRARDNEERYYHETP